MNDATECQEAPRVALSECQGYYGLAVTAAQEEKTDGQRREEGGGEWKMSESHGEERDEVGRTGEKAIAFLTVTLSDMGRKGG